MATDCTFVIGEKTFGIEQRDKNGQIKYIEKGTFSIELEKHIDTGGDSGFLCQIYCSLREQSRYSYCNKSLMLNVLINLKINSLLVRKLFISHIDANECHEGVNSY